MRYLITYDVETSTKPGRRRLRRLARACLDYGQRVQFSVFECDISKTEWVLLRDRLLKEYDEKKDSLRFYPLDDNVIERIEHYGRKKPKDMEEPMIV